MAKKRTVKAPEIPEIYRGLDTTKAGTEKTLVLDKHKQVFKFDSTSNITIVKEGIDQQWGCWEIFHKWCEEHKPEFSALHELAFKENLKAGDDVLMVSLYLWKKLLLMAADRTEAGNPINQPREDGAVRGKRKTETRRYFLGEGAGDTAKILLIKTPQARACFMMLRDALKDRTPAEITEEEFKKVVITRAAELKTRQDPWRIFQYYRPTLLQDKLIRHD